ncbi:hypothetical protein MKW92_022356, partial [Papaver armeniacum]
MEGFSDFSLVLALPKDDAFFEKKKKLLQLRGYGPEIQIPFSSSDDPLVALQAMVEVTRILHLDEVISIANLFVIWVEAISHFGGVTALGMSCNSFWWGYSPRNELESLNSVLKLIDMSLKDAAEKKIDVLLVLRNAVIEMIREFGDKSSEETGIVKCGCKGEDELVEWGRNHGVQTKLQIAYVEGAGRGAVAVEDLEVGECALEIPVSVIISEDIVYESDMMGTLLFEEIMQAKEHLRTQYDELCPALCSNHPDVFQEELYTWEKFLWACELWYSNSMKVIFNDGKLRTCLVPIAGLLNHSNCIAKSESQYSRDVPIKKEDSLPSVSGDCADSVPEIENGPESSVNDDNMSESSVVTEATLSEHRDKFEAAKSEERAVRKLLNAKDREIDSVQSAINRMKSETSIDEMDDRTEEQLTLDQKEKIEEQFKLLKRELDSAWKEVLRYEEITKAARKIYYDESDKLRLLHSQFGAENDMRQEAYIRVQNLKKQLYEKNKYFRMYKDDADKAANLASARDKEELQRLCVHQ